MKRRLRVLLSILFSFLFVALLGKQLYEGFHGYTKEVMNANAYEKEVNEKVKLENNSSTMQKENSSHVIISYEDKSRDIKDKKGNLLLSITGNMPVITIEGNEEATNKINTYYKERQAKQEEKVKEYLAYATDNFTLLNKEQLSYWNGYGLGDTYSSQRVDDTVISIVDDSYEFAGGAHPNTTKTAQNFDTKSGKLLTLSDVLTDVSKGTNFINDFLLQKMKESEDKVGFFEDYESSIKDILTDQTWYFSEEGFVTIVNTYIVSPYAAGIQEYTIPYSDFPYLKEEYKLKHS